MQTNIKLIEVMNNTAPTATPAAEFAAETSQKQMEDNRDELLHDSHSPLFNLLRKWYREAQEKLTVKENALEEIKIKHQAEINKKDAEIASLAAQVAQTESTLAEINMKDAEIASLTAEVAKNERAIEKKTIKYQVKINKKDKENASLTAQVAKLNSQLADTTRELKEAKQTISGLNNSAAKRKDVCPDNDNSDDDVEYASKSQKREPNNVAWNKHYNELVAYKKQYGNCNVPKRYKKNNLGYWVGHMRTKFKDGKLSNARLAKLNRLGFVWDSHDEAWTNHVNDLVIFRQKHGHCNVPSCYKENKSLFYWVHRMRKEFKAGTLSEERIAELNGLGFVWKERG